jgi:Ni2+-binding GTPase involved in maturation of urease and hydrogenase
LRTVNPDAEVLEISARRGNGLEAWIDYLKHHITP